MKSMLSAEFTAAQTEQGIFKLKNEWKSEDSWKGHCKTNIPFHLVSKFMMDGYKKISKSAWQ